MGPEPVGGHAGRVGRFAIATEGARESITSLRGKRNVDSSMMDASMPQPTILGRGIVEPLATTSATPEPISLAKSPLAQTNE